MTDRPALSTLLDEFVDWHFGEHPIVASILGAEGFDDQLGDFSAAAFEARQRARNEWLGKLEAADGQPGLDEGIDRELMVAVLRGEAIMADWPTWKRDPAVYLGSVFAALHTPLLHRLRPEHELVEAIVARLALVPDVVDACRANLDPELSAALLVHRGVSQARAGRHFLTSALPAEVSDLELRAKLATAAEPAAEAFDGLADYLSDFAECARGDWRLGERRYSALLRDRELLDCDAAELHQRGRAAWAELDAEMSQLSARVAGGSSDWRAATERRADDYPPTLEAMRAEYEEHTERARKFLIEHDLVSFADGESCRVVPSPEFQRPILAVAFYMAPPPLTASRLGHFFVPYTPAEYTEDQVRERLRAN
jgi:uncharacterized protein (DUF885 family)